jgi:undecaprenyl-diphosphatase
MELVTILPKRLCPGKRTDVPAKGRLTVMAWAALLCVLVFAILAWQMKAGGLTAFDGAVTGWVRADITSGLSFLMILITGLGNLDFVTALTTLVVLFLLIRRRWGEGLGVAVASLSSWSFYTEWKLVFQRPRPSLPHLVPTGGYSFPSGHATVTAALFFTLAMIYCRHHQDNHTGKMLAMGAAAFVVLLVGISRVYLGVHYPSDVVAGWAAGGLLALVIAILLRSGSGTS